MRKIQPICVVAVIAVLAFSFASQSSGQASGRAGRESAAAHTLRYRFVDIGTLGGPNSFQPFGFADAFLTERSLSASGTMAGFGSTADADPDDPFCFFDCFLDHAFQFRDGKLTDIGALGGSKGLNSAVTSISADGLISGFSETGQTDPRLNVDAIHGVIWHGGRIVDLGTLPDGFESWANNVNDFGQAVGFADSGVPDPNSIEGFATQTRAFVWEFGRMRDLGTLGGDDAIALSINDRGQIVGQSYAADAAPPPDLHCGDTPLALHAFFWERGVMRDLNTLGGSCTFAYALNIRGQAVGQSTLAGDIEDHPFLWERGNMKDLGTLGGTYGFASWLNDRGGISGNATTEGDQAIFAFKWENGAMSNLGTLPGDACSVADAINFGGQVVGGSGVPEGAFFPACTDAVEHAVLWQNGGAIDLNGFVPDGSDVTLNEASYINEFGEITGIASLPDGSAHVFLLIPCREDESNCEAAHADSITKSRTSKPATAITHRPWATRSRPRPQACTRDCGLTARVLVGVTGNGTVTDGLGFSCTTNCSDFVTKGTAVTFTEVPAAGATFVGWNHNCGNASTCTLTVTGTMQLTAGFSDTAATFSIAPEAASLSLMHGGSVTDAITVSSQNGVYGQPVQLTCAVTGPAPVPVCAFSNATVTPGSNGATSTLRITSTASAIVALRFTPGRLFSIAGLLLAAFGFQAMFAPRRRRLSFALGGSLAVVILMAGCSSSSGSTGDGGAPTPPPSTSYTATVDGDSGNLHQEIQISVTQQ